VIYLDSSAALAQLFAEDRRLPELAGEGVLVSSQLLGYEVWNRIHARGFTRPRADEVRALLARVNMMELSASILSRALEPFPLSVRTLDGLHLATIEYLRAGGQEIELASFDNRLLAGARALGIPIYQG
jgi:hypothetical protein